MEFPNNLIRIFERPQRLVSALVMFLWTPSYLKSDSNFDGNPGKRCRVMTDENGPVIRI